LALAPHLAVCRRPSLFFFSILGIFVRIAESNPFFTLPYAILLCIGLQYLAILLGSSIVLLGGASSTHRPMKEMNGKAKAARTVSRV